MVFGFPLEDAKEGDERAEDKNYQMLFKQQALYNHIWGARMNRRICGPEGNNFVKPFESKVCLFKLSDLGLWKVFPMFLLSWGFEIEIKLSATKALVHVNPTLSEEEKAEEAKDANLGKQGRIAGTLLGLKATEDWSANVWRLWNGRVYIQTIKPDQQHLKSV